MCDMLREMMKDRLAQAKLEGIQENQLKAIINVMEFFSVDADRAMDIFYIPTAEREIYRSKLP